MKLFSMIAAIDENGGIGKDNGMPWHLPKDLKFFQKVTSKVPSSSLMNAVIMGRKTWESIDGIYKPLPGRLNVVLSRNKDFETPEGVLHFTNLDEALAAVNQRDDVARMFVIGGGVIFKEAIAHEACGRLYLTHIYKDFDCTVFFPNYEDDFIVVNESRVYEHKKLSFSFSLYERL